MDPTTVEAVQPSEGQGGASGGTPYAEYLDRIPEELRPQVQPVFQEWDANVTRRFQDLSAAGKRWEGFEQAGLHEYDPQSLSQLVQFAQMAEQDPAAYAEWLRGQAESAGLLTQQSQPSSDDSYVDPALQKLIQEQLEQRLGPVQQQLQNVSTWQQQQEFSRAQQAEADRIQQRLDQLRDEHGEFPVDFVEKLTANYVTSDPQNAVDRAFGDYQRLRADIEKGVFASKLDQPATPEITGAPHSAPEPVTTLKQAEEIAIQRLRHANRS